MSNLPDSLSPSISIFVRPIRSLSPSPIATGLAPLAPAGYGWVHYVNLLIIKDKLGSLGQIRTLGHTHYRAPF
jgi:hypothetical protein